MHTWIRNGPLQGCGATPNLAEITYPEGEMTYPGGGGGLIIELTRELQLL